MKGDNMKKASAKIPKVGQKIYVDSHYYISHGSDDDEGGIATIESIKESISGGKKCIFVTVKEHPGSSYNWEFLSEKQSALKKEFGKRKAHPCPDIDTPWIEEGDIVDGKPYKGPPIW